MYLINLTPLYSVLASLCNSVIDVYKNQSAFILLLLHTTNSSCLNLKSKAINKRGRRIACSQSTCKPPLEDGTSKARSERGGARCQPCAPIGNDVDVVPGVSSLDLPGVSSMYRQGQACSCEGAKRNSRRKVRGCANSASTSLASARAVDFRVLPKPG